APSRGRIDFDEREIDVEVLRAHEQLAARTERLGRARERHALLDSRAVHVQHVAAEAPRVDVAEERNADRALEPAAVARRAASGTGGQDAQHVEVLAREDVRRTEMP